MILKNLDFENYGLKDATAEQKGESQYKLSPSQRIMKSFF